MFRSSHRWTVPSWRCSTRPGKPPLPSTQPLRTRGAPLTECLPPPPRAALYLGGSDRRAGGGHTEARAYPSAPYARPHHGSGTSGNASGFLRRAERRQRAQSVPAFVYLSVRARWQHPGGAGRRNNSPASPPWPFRACFPSPSPEGEADRRENPIGKPQLSWAWRAESGASAVRGTSRGLSLATARHRCARAEPSGTEHRGGGCAGAARAAITLPRASRLRYHTAASVGNGCVC